MAINIISRQIVLDVYRHDGTPLTINAIATDNDTRYVAAEIQNDGARYDIGSTATVELMILRPDKIGVGITGEPYAFTEESPGSYNPETEEYTPGETVTYYGVYAELDQAALAKSGSLLGQFKITSGEQVLHTNLFKINNGRALDAETSDWSGEYQGYNLDELVQNVNESVAKVDAMEQDVSELKSGLEDIESDLRALEQEGYPMASIQSAVDAWADEHGDSIINNAVTPQMYGAKGDGISDDTTALQSAINSGKPIFVPDGTYIVTQPLMCRTVCMMELSKNAIVKAQSGTIMSCLLGLRNDGATYSLAENEYICGGIFDGNGCCDAVIGINYTRGKIENCIIQGVKHYGIHIGHNLQSEGVGSGSLRIIDVIVQNTNASWGTIGIYSNRTDNYIRAITKNMETGFSVLSGETLDGCHAWIAFASMFENSVAYLLRSTQNILTACTSDTMRYGIRVQSGSGRVNVSDFSYYHNTNVATPAVLEDAPCVVFDFYSRTHIFLATNILVNLADSQGKIISDSAIGSELIRFINLGISQGENAVSANVPPDVSALNPNKIPLTETSETNLTQEMLDAISTNNIIGGYSAISGMEGWAIVITTVNADVRVQTLIRAGHGAVVRRYSNGSWNGFT